MESNPLVSAGLNQMQLCQARRLDHKLFYWKIGKMSIVLQFYSNNKSQLMSQYDIKQHHTFVAVGIDECNNNWLKPGTEVGQSTASLYSLYLFKGSEKFIQ